VLFNSYAFIFIFLPSVLVLYFVLNRLSTRAGKTVLLASSLFFYGYWSYKYLFLLVFSILFNYCAAAVILKSENNIRKNYLAAAIILNVFLLGYFKYTDFFISSVNSTFYADFPLPGIILPLGISFFTLQQIAFLMDCYEGLIKRNSFLNYSLFVTFFPQLVAGPIVHYRETVPQFDDQSKKAFVFPNFIYGLFIFSLGLFKKTALADQLAKLAAAGFDTPEPVSFAVSWLASLSFSMQIFFDFSGYTDMALGLAVMFNIYLPQNFRSPYSAASIIDFWKRWHITLTVFLTNYVYTALARKLKHFSFHKAMAITMITFAVSGIWHGASWMFVIFGLLHGAGIIINHYWKKHGFRLGSLTAWFITINYVNICFVFFRAQELKDAFNLLHAMFNPYKAAEALRTAFAYIKNLNVDILMQLNSSYLAFAAGITVCILLSRMPEKKPGALDGYSRTGVFSLSTGFIAGIMLWISFKIMLGEPSKEFVYFAF